MVLDIDSLSHALLVHVAPLMIATALGAAIAYFFMTARLARSMARTQDLRAALLARCDELQAMNVDLRNELDLAQWRLRRREARSGSDIAPTPPATNRGGTGHAATADLAQALKAMSNDMESLQGLSTMTERWYEQMLVVIGHNKALRTQLEVFEKLAKSFDVVAINAAVTAAKAGSQGKGFGVVAEHVRELAGQTAREASHYARMIEKNSFITTTTFQEIQSSGNLIRTAMFSLRAALDRLQTVAASGADLPTET